MLEPAFVLNGLMGRLYRTHWMAIYHRCRRLLADDHAAEDAAQETFLRVHRHIHRLPGPSEVLRWMYRIATNYCLNELRRRGRAPLLVGDQPEPPPVVAPLGDPFADKATAHQIIAALPEELRVVAGLHHVEGLSHDEVATAVGMSRGTVIKRLAAFEKRARRMVGMSGNSSSRRREVVRPDERRDGGS